MNRRDPAQEPSALLHELLDIAEAMVDAGAEVYRVEDTITRMGEAYGAERMNVLVITSSIVITMLFADGCELTQTRRIRGAGSTNFIRLERLNALSRECCAKPLPLSELQRRTDEILALRSSPLRQYIGSILGAGAFAVFFGGNLWDGLVAALFGVLICFLQQKLSSVCRNRMIFNLLGALVSGIGIMLTVSLFPALHADKIVIGDIMLLIPGLAITNSVRDIMGGDTITGIMRFIECLLWAAALAFGFMIALRLTGGLGV
ncbi:MAG: threonine/serine exporter family protein [Oscillospiraceae bacterium]|nr:threonine/serine exporter family protein [Oscillospiraceae bacterium]